MRRSAAPHCSAESWVGSAKLQPFNHHEGLGEAFVELGLGDGVEVGHLLVGLAPHEQDVRGELDELGLGEWVEGVELELEGGGEGPDGRDDLVAQRLR